MTMCGDPIQSTLDAQGQGQLEYRGLVQSTPEVQGHSECGNLHEGDGGWSKDYTQLQGQGNSNLYVHCASMPFYKPKD